MSRRDLIPLLLQRAWTLPQLARVVGRDPRDLADDLEHLLRSLPHTEFTADITPARCRKCEFTFRPDKWVKPAKCPQCRSSWIAPPRIALHRRPAAQAGAQAPEVRESDAPSLPPWLSLLDHTADTGLVVTAPDLPALFSRAAWGMFQVLCDLGAVQPAEAETVVLEADDLPALMVRWLSELNFRHITTHRLYARFEVRELGRKDAPSPGCAPTPDAGRDAPPLPSAAAATSPGASAGGPWHLRADVFGERIVPGRHTLFTEIKAVTFHGLELAEVDGGWRAQIILDL